MLDFRRGEKAEFAECQTMKGEKRDVFPRRRGKQEKRTGGGERKRGVRWRETERQTEGEEEEEEEEEERREL